MENGGDAEACRSRPIKKVSGDRVTCNAVRPADAPSYRRRGLTLALVQTVAAANLRLRPIDRQWIHSDSRIGINWCEMAPRVELFSCFCAPPCVPLPCLSIGKLGPIPHHRTRSDLNFPQVSCSRRATLDLHTSPLTLAFFQFPFASLAS